MKITESQLRRIIRQEIRALNESQPWPRHAWPRPHVSSISSTGPVPADPLAALAPVVDGALLRAKAGDTAREVLNQILSDLRSTFAGHAEHRMSTYEALPQVIKMLRPQIDRRLAAELEALAMDMSY